MSYRADFASRVRALFGGAKEADKLLSLREGKTPLDAAWGAAWDIWHCWMVQNYFPALPVDGKPQHAIFVTDDAAAAFIAGQCLPRALFLNAGEPFLSASVLSYNFPFYADKGDLNELLRQQDSQRLRRILSNVSNTNEFDHARVQVEIERLEQAIMTLLVESESLCKTGSLVKHVVFARLGCAPSSWPSNYDP